MDILTIIEQLADFLSRLHAAGYSYHDIKPEHIYWDSKHTRIIDFDNCPDKGPNSGWPLQAEVLSNISMLCGLAFTLLTNPLGMVREPFDKPGEGKVVWGMFGNLVPESVRELVEHGHQGRYATANDMLTNVRECARNINSDREKELKNLESSARVYSYDPVKGYNLMRTSTFIRDSICKNEWERIVECQILAQRRRMERGNRK